MPTHSFCDGNSFVAEGEVFDFVNEEFLNNVTKNMIYRKDAPPDCVDFVVPIPPQTKVDVFFDETMSILPQGGPIRRGTVSMTGFYSTPANEEDIELLSRQKTFVNKETDKHFTITFEYPESHCVAGYRVRPLNKSDENYDIDFDKIIASVCHIPNVSRQEKILTNAEKINFAEKTTQVPKIYTSFIHVKKHTVIGNDISNFTNSYWTLTDNGIVYDVPDAVNLDNVKDAEGIWIPRGYEMFMTCNDSQSITYGPYDHGVLLDFRMFPTEKITQLKFTTKIVYTHTPIFDQNILECFTTRSGESLLAAAVARNRPCIVETPTSSGHIMKYGAKYGSFDPYFTPKFLDNNKYLSSFVNPDTSIGLIVPEYISITVGGSVIGPFTTPWLLPLRGEDIRSGIPITYTDILTFDEKRAAISKSIDNSSFFISDTKIDTQIIETNDDEAIDETFVRTIRKGESCTVTWTEKSHTYKKVFGPYTHDVHLYKTWRVMDESENITIQPPRNFWNVFDTRRDDVKVTVDYNDILYVFYKGAVITDKNVDGMKTDIILGFGKTSDGVMKKLTEEIMFDAVQFRFERHDIPQYIPSIRGIEKKHVFLPKNCQILFSSGESQTSNHVIIGPYSHDCQFKMSEIGFTPKMYRLFEFGSGITTNYSRNDVETVLQTKFFASRDVQIINSGGETVSVSDKTSMLYEQDAKSIFLPRGTELCISHACDVQVPSFSADSNYGPFDYDTEIDVSERFANTPINISWEMNKNYIPRQDVVVRSSEFQIDGYFTQGVLEYAVRNDDGHIEYKKYTETLTVDDTEPSVIDGTIFPSNFIKLESIHLPANYSATIFTKSCIVEFETSQEHRVSYLNGCTGVEKIIIRHDPQVPFTVHKGIDSSIIEMDEFEKTVQKTSNLLIRSGEIVILTPTSADDIKKFGSIEFGPYLQQRNIDLSNTVISDIECIVTRVIDTVLYNEEYSGSVTFTPSSTKKNVIQTDEGQTELYESLVPTRIQGKTLERVEVQSGWLLTLFTEIDGYGFTLPINARDDCVINTKGSAFERAKSYTASRIPIALRDGVLSVRVYTQTMATGDSWAISNGIKNGLDSEVTPMVEKNFFEWKFNQQTNFFGFKVNDPEILRQARNNELVIDVRTPTMEKHGYDYKVSGNDWVMFYDFNTTENPMNEHYVPNGNVKYVRKRVGAPDVDWLHFPQEIFDITETQIRQVDGDGFINEVYQLIDRVNFDTLVALARDRTLQSTNNGHLLTSIKNYPMFLTFDFYDRKDVDADVIGSIVYRLHDDGKNQKYFYKMICAHTVQNGVIFGPKETDLITLDILSTGNNRCSPAQWSNLRFYFIDSKTLDINVTNADDIDIDNVQNPGGVNSTVAEYDERPYRLFDDNVNTKWLDKTKSFDNLKMYKPRITIPLKKPLIIIGIDADSANDHPESDPIEVDVNDDFTEILTNTNVWRQNHMIYVRSGSEREKQGKKTESVPQPVGQPTGQQKKVPVHGNTTRKPDPKDLKSFAARIGLKKPLSNRKWFEKKM